MTRVFPLRGGEDEISDISAKYFKAMRRFTIGQVSLGAEAVIERLKKWPKPAEWIEMIPRASAPSVIPPMESHRAAEWLDAEQKVWEDEPCRCPRCQVANVTHRFLRFVPEFTPDDREDKAMIGERAVCRGHWAHGEELRRYYVAKEAFWEQAHAHFIRALDVKVERRRRAETFQRLITPKQLPPAPPTETP